MEKDNWQKLEHIVLRLIKELKENQGERGT